MRTWDLKNIEVFPKGYPHCRFFFALLREIWSYMKWVHELEPKMAREAYTKLVINILKDCDAALKFVPYLAK